MINNTFLVLYSHLEEWLYHIWKTYGNTIVLSSKSRGSISRFRPVLKHALNIDLSKDEKWQFVVEAEKIRDCLLHANARIDLFKDANKLKNLLRKRRDLLSEKRSRLYINQSYVEKFFECVQYIILRVESTQET